MPDEVETIVTILFHSIFLPAVFFNSTIRDDEIVIAAAVVFVVVRSSIVDDSVIDCLCSNVVLSSGASSRPDTRTHTLTHRHTETHRNFEAGRIGYVEYIGHIVCFNLLELDAPCNSRPAQTMYSLPIALLHMAYATTHKPCPP